MLNKRRHVALLVPAAATVVEAARIQRRSIGSRRYVDSPLTLQTSPIGQTAISHTSD